MIGNICRAFEGNFGFIDTILVSNTDIPFLIAITCYVKDIGVKSKQR